MCRVGAKVEALAFDGKEMLVVADAPSLRFGGDYTVIVVARSNTPASNYAALYGKSRTLTPFEGPGMYVNYAPHSGARSSSVGAQVDFDNFIQSAEKGMSDGVTRIFEMQRSGSSLGIRVNAGPVTASTVPPVDVTASGVDVFIGGHYTTTLIQTLTGAIGEVLAINGAVSSEDYAALRRYLTLKYAL